MKISELLLPDVMLLDLKATTKQAAFDEMIDQLYAADRITDKQEFLKGILAREAQTTTGLGDGIAMPHAKNNAVKQPTVAFARSKNGVDYDAMDGQPVHLLFMIAVPANANNTHLEALASLSRYLLQDGFMDKLKQAETPAKVVSLFTAQESESTEVVVDDDAPFLVAVTACTTGIAHTYMAEEALKKHAEKLGIRIKVETNGASGVGNKLTDADIAHAQGVIIAADKKVDMARFDGKPLINRPVADGIRKPDELIDLALRQTAPVYHSNEPRQQSTEAPQSIGKAFYRHLMSGVSSMLPFVIGGGIAIAFAFLIDQSLGVPNSALSSLGTYHPIAAFFKQIGGAAFGFMLPVLAGYIAYSIAEKPGLVAGFVAGALSANGYNLYNVGLNANHAPIPSGFLGALVGGFLAGGIMLLLKKAFQKLPKTLDGIKSILFYPVLGVLLTGFAMLLINIPMSAINTGLNNFLSGLDGTNAVLLGAILGGMMSIDMGGPINKAAYVFGTGTLAATVASGGSVIMAAVMAGGMVPPLAVFVATLLFKHKFDQQERQAGLTNIVMGLSFITEGAIPFAAADPVRAIPSFMVGSVLSGGLVGLAGIKLLAPHGGIFVIALTSSPLLYLLFIAIGAVVSGIVYGFFKKAV
ncbi:MULTISPECIES: PTS fructose transporter subunit IIABC [Leuconostoc]|uniref:Fructose-specific PTS transporter subunit EIIC n=1 Tax=Leuconostoc gelidum subsp. gelidum TaxID=1607839 RepID=A0AB35FY79_LEUGE|nr:MULTISPECIES: fructose-specific PTS transporter subunit EIIC [Leuconostoc]MBR2276367.1 PTS sugar transporter subunit IIA [Leuconostoc sp.]MBZ5964379.1 fructose-specific PTS transporter subunit EIIC [Leuconostoc gelidum subsp. gelidum]MBZ5975022.1 fructose-specific PTS transporter subunit EIIC [Leuconostoc gelidum subsp. gelidum]MBZ5977014.1 fructose-specific PTS transporter subunit EIIC [Leuconostoc gelidum subsp. gelidum]MBZ5978025.1 fructose-specific PTS transporter subunit EIIC [Leuconos